MENPLKLKLGGGDEIYGKMTVLSICSNIKYASVLRGSGDVKSNNQNIAESLSNQLPSVLDKSNYYVFELQRSSK